MTTNNSVNTYIVPTTANEVTKPSQPAFLAIVSAIQPNVTGNGTAVDPIPYNTEIFDQNADYNNGTYIFTAPVTGRYLFSANIFMIGLTAAMTVIEFWLVTSNRTYHFPRNNPGATRDVNNLCIYGGTAIADMDATDTAKMTVTIYNGAGDTADIQGHAVTAETYFSGCLVV